MTKQVETLLEGALHEVVAKHGVYGYRPVGPLHVGEPVTLSDGHRTIGVEIRVTDLTGWEHER